MHNSHSAKPCKTGIRSLKRTNKSRFTSVWTWQRSQHFLNVNWNGAEREAKRSEAPQQAAEKRNTRRGEMGACLGLVDARAMVGEDLLALGEVNSGRVTTARIAAVRSASRLVRVPHSPPYPLPDSATAPPPSNARSREKRREQRGGEWSGATSGIHLEPAPWQGFTSLDEETFISNQY